jgi:hypothetical protein
MYGSEIDLHMPFSRFVVSDHSPPDFGDAVCQLALASLGQGASTTVLRPLFADGTFSPGFFFDWCTGPVLL